MTRFDAADSAERRILYADAIAAHRQRASPFVTIEADADGGTDDTDQPIDADGEDDSTPELPPWVQFADGVLNLDCTDEELDRLKDLLGQFPAFKVEALERPEEAEGTNVRVSAKVDEKRLGEFVERTFRDVYDLEADYRAWVVEV